MNFSTVSVERLFYCFLFLFLMVFSFSAAQPRERIVPENLSGLLTSIEEVMKKERIPGLMLAIVTRDSVVFSGGLGYSDIASGRKVDGKQKFRLGSTTKLMVAMGLLHLIHNGKLALDTKLKDIAPEIPFVNPWEQTDPVRIINLLEHTAGFTDAAMNKTINLADTDLKGLDVLKFYQDQLVSRFRPGTVPLYTNTAYTVLGYVIEKITGKEWSAYITENVLLPLGMQHTDFKLHLPESEDYANGYYPSTGGHLLVPRFALNSNGAHGAMNSCADDMAKLISFFLNDWRLDTIQWLPDKYLHEMETVHTTLGARHGLKNGYGLGNHVETWHPKSTFHGHGGTIQGFVSHMIYDREKGIGMMISKNGGYNDAHIAMLVSDFLTRDFPAVKPPEKEIPKDVVQSFLGYYKPMSVEDHYGFFLDLGNDISLELQGNKVLLEPLIGPPIPLSHTGDLQFRRSYEHEPTFALGHDEHGKKILMSASPTGGYHMKVSSTGIFLKRVFTVMGVLAFVTALFMGIISLVRISLNKIKPAELPVVLTPMIAVISLGIGLWPLLQWQANYLSFTELNTVTATVFLGTLFFGVFAALGLWFLYFRWNSLRSVWSKFFVAYSVVGIASIAVWLLSHGMIGTMIWKWQ